MIISNEIFALKIPRYFSSYYLNNISSFSFADIFTFSSSLPSINHSHCSSFVLQSEFLLLLYLWVYLLLKNPFHFTISFIIFQLISKIFAYYLSYFSRTFIKYFFFCMLAVFSISFWIYLSL